MTKAIKLGVTGKGDKLALVASQRPGLFNVLVQRGNYAGHVKGGIAYTWGAAAMSRTNQEVHLTREDAETLFNRRNKAKA